MRRRNNKFFNYLSNFDRYSLKRMGHYFYQSLQLVFFWVISYNINQSYKELSADFKNPDSSNFKKGTDISLFIFHIATFIGFTVYYISTCSKWFTSSTWFSTAKERKIKNENEIANIEQHLQRDLFHIRGVNFTDKDFREQNFSCIKFSEIKMLHDDPLCYTRVDHSLWLHSLIGEEPFNLPHAPHFIGGTKTAISTYPQLEMALAANEIPLRLIIKWQQQLANLSLKLRDPTFLEKNPHLQDPTIATTITKAVKLLKSQDAHQELSKEWQAAKMAALLDRVSDLKVQDAQSFKELGKNVQQGITIYENLPLELQCKIIQYICGNKMIPSPGMLEDANNQKTYKNITFIEKKENNQKTWIPFARDNNLLSYEIILDNTNQKHYLPSHIAMLPIPESQRTLWRSRINKEKALDTDKNTHLKST